MSRKRKLSRKSENRTRQVQGSCVTCTEVGVGDSSSERRSCVDGTHPPHRTAEENFSRRVNRVVEICPLAKNPLPLMKAKEDTMPDGVRMIGANKQAYMYAGVSPLRRSGTTEYIKTRVVGEDRMALQVRPNYGTSSEGVYGQGSAALLSETPHISNHSRALGGAAKLRRAAHAEVPSAKQDLVNKPIKKTKTPPRLDNSDKVRSGGAGEKVPETHGLSRLGLPGKTGGPDMGGPDLGLNLGPKNIKKFEPEKQILERSKPVKNNPNLGSKKVKKPEPEKQILERSEPKKNNPNLGQNC